MPQSATSRNKQRKTFSLSNDVVAVLENYRKKQKLESVTAALEQIVREWNKSDVAEQVTAYYDLLSDEEVEQHEALGKFSESQM